MNILFLCTHNSARSILAEGWLNHASAGRFKAFSAGSQPRLKQQPHPMALKTLAQAGISTNGLYSKSWDTFASPEAPKMDVIITVCDSAAGEACPIWPGHPITVHWGFADPSQKQNNPEEMQTAFKITLEKISMKLASMMALDLEKMNAANQQQRLRSLA